MTQRQQLTEILLSGAALLKLKPLCIIKNNVTNAVILTPGLDRLCRNIIADNPVKPVLPLDPAPERIERLMVIAADQDCPRRQVEICPLAQSNAAIRVSPLH